MGITTSDGKYYEDEFDYVSSFETPPIKTMENKKETTEPSGSPEVSLADTNKEIYLVRHGHTDLNGDGKTSQDKIRGWSDVPLNEQGRTDALNAAKSLDGKGITAIVASDLDRAKETADIIGKHIGVTPTYTMKLRPWDLGKFTGQPAKESLEALKEYSTTKSQEKVPQGESFQEFKDRTFQGVSEALQQHPGDQLAIVTHHRVDRLLHAWDKAGQPIDGSIDDTTFTQKGAPPGGHVKMSISDNVHTVGDYSHWPNVRSNMIEDRTGNAGYFDTAKRNLEIANDRYMSGNDKKDSSLSKDLGVNDIEPSVEREHQRYLERFRQWLNLPDNDLEFERKKDILRKDLEKAEKKSKTPSM